MTANNTDNLTRFPVAGAAARCHGRCCLVQIHPPDVHGGLIRIPETGLVIGRDESAQFVVRDDSVSRRHARLEWSEAGFVLVDLESTNGSYVNEQQVTSQLLRAGDRLRLANHIFKFLSDDHIEAQYHETVYLMMTKDALTGAHNKRYFLEVLERESERCRRFGRPSSLILFDLDYFKQVNDRHGHLAGDEVLQELGARVNRIVRRDEVFARFGGEEFAMVLGEVGLPGAMKLAERLLHTVGDSPFKTSAGEISVTISAGVTSCKTSESTSEELIEAADRCLYEAKQQGRNRICCSSTPAKAPEYARVVCQDAGQKN